MACTASARPRDEGLSDDDGTTGLLSIFTAEGSLVDPTLTGGEVVRICNPCVPDPNTSPPSLQMDRPSSGRQGRSVSNRNRGVYSIDRIDADSEADLQGVNDLGYFGHLGRGGSAEHVTAASSEGQSDGHGNDVHEGEVGDGFDDGNLGAQSTAERRASSDALETGRRGEVSGHSIYIFFSSFFFCV